MNTRFTVIVNAYHDYALHDLDQPIPSGWRDLLVVGSLADCQAYIRKAQQCLPASAIDSEPAII
ncbi:uncharacterized protein YbdZ (MbtH family) [Chitinivorax tropicus]|uniref:Uncharacterized protein YbdZ (MbtH family) n=1 Tax=Chitinivorax tropicus TaxID=714531 RepID=A0A840MJK5_9PROT|nr:MbtH family NRPS accessory protein [Chitinivorax tropicus]MBB5016746.1 uncharacterized protein YbdZ (MbtH family) [Chitinivorax tropicus]